jgi:hypothetical protein
LYICRSRSAKICLFSIILFLNRIYNINNVAAFCYHSYDSLIVIMISGSVVDVIVWYLDLQLLMQSVPITTNVVSWNPAQARCNRYNNDNVCQWLATGRWFSPDTLVSSTNKTTIHDITEILLKVTLSAITVTPINDFLQ